MSQQKVLQILTALGGKAKGKDIRALAKKWYPEDTLYQYVGNRLSHLANAGLVKHIGNDEWQLIELGEQPKEGQEKDWSQYMLIKPRAGDVLNPIFFEASKIKPITIEEDDAIEVETQFMHNLLESLRAGYDPEHPIIIAESKNEQVNGQLVDGMHRCFAIQELQKEGLIINPVVKRIAIKDLDDLDAQRLRYDQLNQSKNFYTASKKAHLRFGTIMDRHPELDTLEKTLAFFKEKQIANTQLIQSLFKRRLTLQKERWERNEQLKQLIIKRNKGNGRFSDNPNAGNSLIAHEVPRQDYTPPATEDHNLVKCPHCDKKFRVHILADGRMTLEYP